MAPFPVELLVHVVAGAAGQGIEIYILFFEVFVLLDVFFMAPVAHGNLQFFLAHRIDLPMNDVAHRAIYGFAIV